MGQSLIRRKNRPLQQGVRFDIWDKSKGSESRTTQDVQERTRAFLCRQKLAKISSEKKKTKVKKRKRDDTIIVGEISTRVVCHKLTKKDQHKGSQTDDICVELRSGPLAKQSVCVKQSNEKRIQVIQGKTTEKKAYKELAETLRNLSKIQEKDCLKRAVGELMLASNDALKKQERHETLQKSKSCVQCELRKNMVYQDSCTQYEGDWCELWESDSGSLEHMDGQMFRPQVSASMVEAGIPGQDYVHCFHGNEICPALPAEYDCMHRFGAPPLTSDFDCYGVTKSQTAVAKMVNTANSPVNLKKFSLPNLRCNRTESNTNKSVGKDNSLMCKSRTHHNRRHNRSPAEKKDFFLNDTICCCLSDFGCCNSDNFVNNLAFRHCQ